MKIALVIVLGLISLVVFLKWYARTDSQRIKTIFRIYKKIKQDSNGASKEELVSGVIKAYDEEYDKSGLFEKMLGVNNQGRGLIEGICKNWSIKNLTLNILMWDNLLVLKREIEGAKMEKIRKQVDEIYLIRGMEEYE